MIQLEPTIDDDPQFVGLIEATISGALRRYGPASVIVVRIEGWFGEKWLGFSAKLAGAVGFWGHDLTIPPFVPNRVESQRRFRRHDDRRYVELDAGPPLHVAQPSSNNLQRKLAKTLPGTCCFWYSGSSAASSRGSLPSYIPSDDGDFAWYVGYRLSERWRATVRKNISTSELESLSLG